ncbi:bifunctional diguanylate cyclase/phosphodiesterase [Mycolicibacterium sp. P1-5]|uniref:putative bifunctional diguanylate cyclase/phosphodiesterase n=1 Tax=Mycolicibacterium sp. P1-5 TaxID=2024617 RepID=UPI0011F09865|nr:bifunctional diguanylate cyclase/phosphodiesterase [Mycolicibacterium sp. P1-5]KAA0112097.1 bifunctional diguanylate cyclase/phosphodiesterase [Mycolicibacterium sp. P1-5]
MVVGLVVCVLVIGMLFALTGWLGGSRITLASAADNLMTALAAVATIAAAITARTGRGRVRIAWTAMSIGLASFTLGAVLWFFYRLAEVKHPYPSVADVAYLVLPIATAIALLLLSSGLSRTSRTRLILDGLIVAGSFVIVGWAVVLDELWKSVPSDRMQVAVSVSYPVLDAAVLTIGVLVVARAQRGQRRTPVLLTLAMLGIAMSDGAFVYLTATRQSTATASLYLGWLVGLALFGAAAIAARGFVHRETVAPQAVSWTSVWLPFVPLLLASAAIFTETPQEIKDGPIPVIGVVLLLAFSGRQLLVMSENRSLLATVAEQALRDPLTGVGNRIVFRDRLNHAMQLRQRDGLSVAVLAMDLDDFKVVNDTLGHPVGDELLSLVAERIVGSVRAGDTVARLGGDEFAVLIEGRVDNSQLVAHRVVEAFDEPFIVDGQDLLIRPSAGLAVAEADDPDLTAEDLLKRAGIAMYAAKRSRTGGVHPFNSEMLLAEAPDSDLFGSGSLPTTRSGAGTIRLLSELRQAIDQFELTLVYQPKFDLNTAAIVGVEALVRWPHPTRGLLAPDEFLPLVRRYGLMGSITDLVVNQALDDVLRWRADSLEIPIAVNVFAPSMADLRLPGKFAKALAARDLDPSQLTVEITEDLFLDNMERTRAVLDQLQEHGIRIAIDDFGSGYSALSYMRDLTVDEVKLDRHFIAPIPADKRAAAVVRAVINLAAELGLSTVAEGIETATTADWLREQGCNIGQGYYFSPPLTADKLRDLLKRCRTDGGGQALGCSDRQGAGLWSESDVPQIELLR